MIYFFVDKKRFIYYIKSEVNSKRRRISHGGFFEIVNGLNLLKLFTTGSILDVWRGPECKSGSARFCFLELIDYS